MEAKKKQSTENFIVTRVVGSIVGCIIVIFIIFFYVIPIYNFKNAHTHIRVITHVIVNGSEENLNDELESRNRMKLVSDAQLRGFVEFVNVNQNRHVTGELISSDNIIISVLNDSSEARLVLGQEGILSQWQLVNVRFLRR